MEAIEGADTAPGLGPQAGRKTKRERPATGDALRPHKALLRPEPMPRSAHFVRDLQLTAASIQERRGMATMITEECINCGACEPECPNTAIYEGGVQWESADGSMHDAITEDIYYIVPQKCTECVGFFDQEQCAAVCPVDCCVPNPQIPETEDVLLERAKTLHADVE